MSRIDSHISTIRNKLALGIFIQSLAWGAIGLGLAVLMAILLERVLDRSLAHPALILLAGAAATSAGAFIYSLTRRPDESFAAVKIDEALGLKEKFSTAIYARSLGDPFAQASVLDAEQTASRLQVSDRFPLAFPRQWYAAVAIFFAAFLVAELMPPLDWFSKTAKGQEKKPDVAIAPRQDEYVKQALPTILAPATMPSASDQIKRAGDELNNAMHTNEGDTLRSHRSLLSALQDYNKTMVDELKKNEKFQTALEEQNQLASLSSAKDESTPMGKAQNDLKAGNLDSAMNDIAAAVNNFNKMTPADQQKMVQQAKQLAQQLSHAANDPRTNQKIAQQLMQMGANQSQAQQLAAAMQQAAQGNSQAQQQLQQAAQQMLKQMNNGQGPTPQQQQQIQQMMAKAQAMANSQAQAQSLSAAAQQMAAAMAQAHSAQQSSANGQSSKPGQGQGGQPSNSQNGIAGAQQAMQQQLQQMQANAKDAQAMQAAANAASQAAADQASGLSGSSGDSSQQADASGANGQNQSPHGGNNPKQGGQAGWSPNPGKGGAKMGIAMAPASFKQEFDPSVQNPQGKILASRYVKAGIDAGKSTAGLRDVATSAQKDAPDDIDQDHVPREAQEAEKDYFSAMQQQDGN